MRLLWTTIRVVSVVAIGLSASTVSAGGQSLLDSLIEVETTSERIRPNATSEPDLRTRISSLEVELRKSVEGAPDGAALVDRLNRFVFDYLRIEVSQDLKDPANLFLSSVLERRRGYCVGIAALYLVLAERLDLPLFAVATPSHLFLRYDDGTTRINIETFQRGANVPDEQYIREQKIPERSIREAVFLRNLTPDQFLAQVYNNLGVILSERKDYDAAAAQYELAIQLDRKLPAARYNYGNDLLLAGEYRKAVRLFSKSLSLYPNDPWALNNRGLAYLRRGKLRKARRDIEEALRLNPTFAPALNNLERIN